MEQIGNYSIVAEGVEENKGIKDAVKYIYPAYFVIFIVIALYLFKVAF